jgi:hypothetical protein
VPRRGTSTPDPARAARSTKPSAPRATVLGMEKPDHVTEKEWKAIQRGYAKSIMDGDRVKLSPAGSHKTWAGWESRICYVCNGDLTLEGPAFVSAYMVEEDRAISWHIGTCPDVG